MQEADLIVCPTSKWYLQRRLLMAVMFLAMGGWFFYDFAVKYPRDRKLYAEWYPELKRLVIDKRKDGQETDASKEGRQKYAELVKQHPEWPDNPEDKEVDWDKKISGQMYWGIGSTVLGFTVLGFFLANRGRPLRADREAIITPWGKRVPFSSVSLVDKRKWDNKWLAYARYTVPGGKPSRVVIDGFIYDGAQKVLDRLLENFSGDVLEIVKEEPKTSGEPAAESGDAPKPDAGKDSPASQES